MVDAKEAADKAYAERPVNTVGTALLAHVHLTEAVAFDPEKHDIKKPSSWPVMAAKDYDEARHGHMKFFCKCCLEKGAAVQLRRPSRGDDPKGGYYQNLLMDVFTEDGQPVVDPVTEKQKTVNQRYYFEPHFSTYPHQNHSPVCESYQKQQELSATVRELGGTTLNSEHGVRFLGLNIPAGQTIIRPKHEKLSDESGANFNAAASGSGRLRIHRSARHHRRRTEGVTSVADLGVLLDSSEGNNKLRDHIILRAGHETFRLSELYHDDAHKMLESLVQRQTENPKLKRHPVAYLLTFGDRKKNIPWVHERNGSRTLRTEVKGEAADGHDISTKLSINFDSPEAERDFENAFKAGNRSFLVYTENAHPDPRNRVVQMQISTTHQVTSWKPKTQLSFGFDTRPQMDLEEPRTPQH